MLRVSPEIKKSVVFLGVKRQDATTHYYGTGFLVSVPSVVSNAGSLYIVTAKHIAVRLKDTEFFVRANCKTGCTTTFNAPKNFTWWFHPDEVECPDVAVFPLVFPPKVFASLDLDYAALNVEMFVTDQMIQDRHIGETDDVLIVGLFAYHFGNRKNQPIMRAGMVAMVPDERVQTKNFGSMEAYLIESRSIGGLSGSPVFVVKQTGVGYWRSYLLGLVHGHWDISPETLLDTSTEDAQNKSGVNVGIAIVLPAKKIFETLNQRKLVEFRRADEEAWRLRNQNPEGSS